MNSHPVPVIACKNLCKSYHERVIHVDVFHDVTFSIYPKELVSIVGPSGSGKSTLLHLLGGLDKPTSGEIMWSGLKIADLNQSAISRLRNKTLGFVYQFHHLLAEFSAWENVAMPLLIGGVSATIAKEKAEHLLAEVGLAKRLQHKISELSGGERQRTAIARSLVIDPLCVLADEPTGNLDMKTAEQVFDVMLSLQEKCHTSFIIVTHDILVAKKTQRIVRIEEGRVFDSQ